MTAPTPLYDMPLGIEGLLMVGDAGTTPTVVLSIDTKFEYSIENTAVEWNTRGDPVFTSGYAGQKLTASFEVQKDNLNVSYQLLQTAAQTRIPIAIKSLDKTSGFGIDADWTIKTFKETQDKEGQDVVAIEITLNKIFRNVTFTNPS